MSRRLTDDQRRLAADYLPLARKLAKPLKQMFPRWSDEFESCACLSLVESARDYQASRGVSFAAFARFRIRGDLARALGSWRYRKGRLDLAAIRSNVSLGFSAGRVVLDRVAPPVGSEYDDIDSFRALAMRLPAKHRRVVTLYYLHGKTMAEIASEIGCCKEEACRLHRASVKLLAPAYRDGQPFTPLVLHKRRPRKAPNTST